LSEETSEEVLAGSQVKVAAAALFRVADSRKRGDAQLVAGQKCVSLTKVTGQAVEPQFDDITVVGDFDAGHKIQVVLIAKRGYHKWIGWGDWDTHGEINRLVAIGRVIC
jgi:hypothetical protein